MAGQLRLYTANNFRRNLAGPQYPDTVVLKGRELEYFNRISGFINMLDEDRELTLEKSWITGEPWGLIVDLLFPYSLERRHTPSNELFLFRENGNPYLNPNRNVTIEDLRKVLDYFMIGNPKMKNREQVLDEIILSFAYDRPGAPKRPQYAHFTISEAEERRRQQERFRSVEQGRPNIANIGSGFWNNVRNGNNENNWPNNNENEGVELGYTEEEEEALGKLKGANVKRYFKGGKTRRVRKLNKKTRKH